MNHLKAKGRKEEGVVQVQQIISYLLALQWLLFFNLSNINIGRVKKDIFCLQDRHYQRNWSFKNMKETLSIVGTYIKTVHSSHLWGAIVWHKASDKGMKDIFSRQMVQRDPPPPSMQRASANKTQIKICNVLGTHIYAPRGYRLVGSSYCCCCYFFLPLGRDAILLCSPWIQ